MKKEEREPMAAEEEIPVEVTEEASEVREEEAPAEETEEAGAEAEEAEGADDAGEAAEGQKGPGDRKPFFQRKEKKNPLQEKVDELNDRVMRQMAEFENYRKRTEKEKSQMFENGAASVLEKILPVIDNFERGFAMVEESDKEDAFVDGMNKVYKQLMSELEKMGVQPIEAQGKEFDPAFHNAVMQTEDGDVESGCVAQELQKGYLYKDTVLRHSMVAVKQ